MVLLREQGGVLARRHLLLILRGSHFLLLLLLVDVVVKELVVLLVGFDVDQIVADRGLKLLEIIAQLEPTHDILLCFLFGHELEHARQAPIQYLKSVLLVRALLPIRQRHGDESIADHLEQNLQNLALNFKPTLVEAVCQHLEYILDQVDVVDPVELVGQHLVLIHVIENEQQRFKPQFKYRAKLVLESPNDAVDHGFELVRRDREQLLDGVRGHALEECEEVGSDFGVAAEICCDHAERGVEYALQHAWDDALQVIAEIFEGNGKNQ